VKRKPRRKKKPAPAPVVEQKGRTATSIAALLALFTVFMQSLSDLFALGGAPRDGTGGGDGGNQAP
jgi:hypothetical protein